MTMNQLTNGAIKALYNSDANNTVSNPVVQLINIKGVQAANGTRYRVIISNGTHFMQAMLSTQTTPLVESGEISRYCLLRLKEFVCNEIQNRRILIILNLDVVAKGFESRLGNPVNIENSNPTANNTTDAGSSPAPSVPAHQPQQQSPQQPLFMRNSGSSYGGGSLNMSLESSLFPIKGLNPYQNKWVIKARVTQKTDIKHWANQKSEGKLFSVNLLDSSGEIKATAFKDQVDRLYPIFEEGKIYYISHARVAMAKKQFSTLDNEYELQFDNGTEVELCADEHSVPTISYNFVKIADMDKHEKFAVVDVIGVLKEDSGIQEIVSKATGRPTKKRELSIVDETQKQIRVTIWDTAAEHFEAHGNPVIAFKGCRVGDFNGRTLSLSGGGNLKVDPDIQEARTLQNWYNAHGTTATFSSFNNMPLSDSNMAPQSVQAKITLQEVKDKRLGESERPDYFATRGTVVYIKPENITYPSCIDCKKKVLQEAEGWRCEKCQKTHDAPQWKYILTLSIEDSSSHLYVNAFDDVGNALIGKTANEIVAIKEADENAYLQLFSEALFKTYNFKARAKQEVFNDTPRTKIQLLEANPIDFVREGNELSQAIEKLLV
ncbi:unnamed protein product [Cunninghamella echinulata]